MKFLFLLLFVSLAINIDVVDTTTSRSWQMHSKQYECGHAMAGPTGCLQVGPQSGQSRQDSRLVIQW